jgi:sulfonate transport system substrate-binding protein
MWGEENARIAKWLKDRNRLTKGLTAKDYEDSFDAKFMERTYQKLGWKVPARAPFIPPDWTGKIGELPYPAYANVTTLKEPQPWPEKGDLTKDWSFNGKTYQP